VAWVKELTGLERARPSCLNRTIFQKTFSEVPHIPEQGNRFSTK